MKKKIVIILSVVIIGIIGVYTTKTVQTSKNIEAPPSVEVDKVVTKKVVTTVDADGIVAFKDKESIYAKNNGKVNSLPIKEGDTVKKGDVLVKYDKSPLETLQRQLEEAKLSLKSANIALEGLMIPTEDSQLIQLEAQISQTEKTILDLENNIIQVDKDIQKAKEDLEGGNILYSQGAISKTEFENFEKVLTNYENQKTSLQNSLNATKKQLEANKVSYETAKNKQQDPSVQNRIESQKVAIEQANLRISQLTKDINDFETVSTSPITGTLVKLYVSDGEAVAEGKLLAEVGDLNNLIIEAYIPEYDMDGIAVGQDVLIKSDAIDGEFMGQIIKIYPLAETKNIGGSEKSVVKTEISMPSNTPLKAGYTTDLTITTNVEDNALVIPIMSYMTEKVDDVSKEYVFIVKDDGTLEKRNIKVKTIKNSVASVEGLEEGEKVVSSPTETMTQGTKITPIDSSSQNNTQNTQTSEDKKEDEQDINQESKDASPTE